MIRNWFNHNPLEGPKATETPYGVSMTIPGQSLPLRTIIDRFVRGVEVYVTDPVYLGDNPEFAGIERMSVLDRLDALMELNHGIAEQRRQMALRADLRTQEAAHAAQVAPPDPPEDQIMSADKKSKAKPKDD